VAIKEIKLSGGAVNAHSKFNVQLGKNNADFALNYSDPEDVPCWSVDISVNGADIINGMMLEPSSEIKTSIGTFFFIGDEVTLDNLGINNNLIWTDLDA